MAKEKTLSIKEARKLLLADASWTGEIWFRLDRPWNADERRALRTPATMAMQEGLPNLIMESIDESG